MKPNSGVEKITEKEGFLEIWIKEPAKKGRANNKVETLLKKYLGKEVKIISGFKSRNKKIKICD